MRLSENCPEIMQGACHPAGLAALSAERTRLFDELNAAYRARFGFPFIIAVRRHGVDTIQSEFRRRVALSPDAGAETALGEVVRIVALRLDPLVEGPDPLPVSGRISTHVLAAASGVPAAESRSSSSSCRGRGSASWRAP